MKTIAAGNYEYVVIAVNEKPKSEWPEQNEFESNGFCPVWRDKDVTGGFYVYRRQVVPPPE